MQTNNNKHNKKPREITIIIIIWKHCYYEFVHLSNFNATSNEVTGTVICTSVTHSNGMGQM